MHSLHRPEPDEVCARLGEPGVRPAVLSEPNPLRGPRGAVEPPFPKPASAPPGPGRKALSMLLVSRGDGDREWELVCAGLEVPVEATDVWSASGAER